MHRKPPLMLGLTARSLEKNSEPEHDDEQQRQRCGEQPGTVQPSPRFLSLVLDRNERLLGLVALLLGVVPAAPMKRRERQNVVEDLVPRLPVALVQRWTHLAKDPLVPC